MLSFILFIHERGSFQVLPTNIFQAIANSSVAGLTVEHYISSKGRAGEKFLRRLISMVQISGMPLCIVLPEMTHIDKCYK